MVYGLVCPTWIWAAIVCNASDFVEVYKTAPSDPEVLSVTIPAGSNQIFIGCFGQRSGGTARTYTNVYNALTPTAITTAAYLDPTEAKCEYQANPAVGAHNYSIDWSAAPLADTIIAGSCSGVDTANPFVAGSINQTTGTGTTMSMTVANVATGHVSIVFLVAEVTAANDFTVTGSNQNVVQQGNAGNEIAAIMTQKDGANGGAHSFSLPENQQYSIHGFALQPAPTALFGPLQRRGF